jgi:SAM-dependent methyltransferase
MQQEMFIQHHYTRPDLEQRLVSALAIAGKRLDALTPDDVAPVDQFHTRGREATIELARYAQIVARDRILDIGGGLGGPARTLASQFQCHVDVLDLTPEYCRVGSQLTDRLRLSDLVTFRQGDALALPYGDGEYDVVWTQHSSMNIDDKAQLYEEIHRVLKPGGRFAFNEIMAGEVAPIHFPVPWARDAAINFLRSPNQIYSLLSLLGFGEEVWIDMSDPVQQWTQERVASGVLNESPLSVRLLLGDDTQDMFMNMLRNIAEKRIRIMYGVWRRMD